MNAVTIEAVRLVRDAQAAWCPECGAFFDLSSCPYWHWRKAQAMHERGTGHRMEIVRLVAPS
jgi:hypothetical protein